MTITLEIPDEFRPALRQLESDGIDLSELFIQAMFGCLADRSEAFSGMDLAVRVGRLEERISALENDKESEESEIVGTLHIDAGNGCSMCGITKKNTFPAGEVRRLLEQSSKTTVCRACERFNTPG